MTIRAEWRLAELDLDADDPFDTMIFSTGLTLDLTGSEDDVHAALAQTLQMEGGLFARGVTCDLKDGGEDCTTCRVFGQDEAILRLCHLGRDQRVITVRAETLAASRNAPFLALGRAHFGYVSLADEYPRLAAALREAEDRAFSRATSVA